MIVLAHTFVRVGASCYSVMDSQTVQSLTCYNAGDEYLPPLWHKDKRIEAKENIKQLLFDNILQF